MERRLGNLEWKGVIEILTPLLQSMLLGDFDILIAGSLPYTAAQASCFLAVLHHLPLFRQNSSFGLGGRPKICKDLDELES